MRMLLQVIFPTETFNAAVRDGSIGKKMQRILEDLKPEAAYFTESEGRRSVVLILNVEEPSKVPVIAEPFFLQFNAECRFRIVMSPEDLAKAGLEAIGKKWA